MGGRTAIASGDGPEYWSDLDLSSDVFTAFRKATRGVTHLYDLVLTPTGLKATQFVLLGAIQRNEGIAQSKLAQEYGMCPETLSRRLAKLRAAGMIERQAASRGGHCYRLTAVGAKTLQSAAPVLGESPGAVA